MYIIETFLLTLAISLSQSTNYTDDLGLTTLELIKKNGYTVESHDVQTDDGYILTVFRIPPKEKSVVQPIFLMHGLLTSSADFVGLGPKKALAYLLNDAGYDVWIGNRRGNYYSLKHTTLDPFKDAEEYWNFTLTEIAKYDIPAYIDYILNATEQEQLKYIGYSEGNADFLIGLTEFPEYNKKVSLFLSLAPPYALTDLKAPLFKLTLEFAEIIKDVSSWFGIYAFYPLRIINLVLTNLYKKNIITQEIGNCILSLLFGGFDYAELNNDFLPVVFSNLPSGVAFKVLIHASQVWRASKPQKYDYGLEGNLLEYGQATPPVFNYSRVTVPTVLYIGKNDWVVSEKDVSRFKGVLPNILEFNVLPYSKLSHIDFVIASNADKLVYKYILQALKKYGS